MAGILWGLGGDCYFRLNESEKGFRAYRRAIELDEKASCLALFACEVAWYRRVQDAEEAFRCLRADRAGYRQSLRRHPVQFFLGHILVPELLFVRFVRIPPVR